MGKSFIETTIVGFLGGYLFYLVHFPLPWVLGALTLIILWQGILKRKAFWPEPLKHGGFLTLGMYFGLYFTLETFITVGPYLLPYLLMTFLLIGASIYMAIIVAKKIEIDKVTSVFGSIPGGLSEMVIASEALHAKTSFVTIFQTVRLLTVLFTVPSIIMYFFKGHSENIIILSETVSVNNWNYSWFLLPIFLGILFRKIIPAGIVIIPLIVTALMNVGLLELPTVPSFILISAQVAVGLGLGKSVSFSDLKLGGKYCFVYFCTAILLILVAFCLGSLLAYFTSLDLATAILSIAPGGLIEMVLTAKAVGGDPAIVSALQMIRIVVIIGFVPTFLRWFLKKEIVKQAA